MKRAPDSSPQMCLPVLLLDLPDWIAVELGDVLRNDLL
jgi:hypothetical protein